MGDPKVKRFPRPETAVKPDLKRYASVGHNKPPAEKPNSANEQLRAFIQRIEKLEEERSDIAADIRDVFAEAKGQGFDNKTMRTVLKIRKLDASEREEQEALLDTYLRALGMDMFSRDDD